MVGLELGWRDPIEARTRVLAKRVTFKSPSVCRRDLATYTFTFALTFDL